MKPKASKLGFKKKNNSSETYTYFVFRTSNPKNKKAEIIANGEGFYQQDVIMFTNDFDSFFNNKIETRTTL